MLLENLSIRRVVIHQVFKRKDDRQIIPPRYGAEIIALGHEEVAALQDRIVKSLGSTSKCMEMTVVSAGDGTALAISKDLADSDDTLFIETSRRFADLLAHAQTRQNIPGGLLLVFSGSVGYPEKRIIGVIKAEPHAGFAFPEAGALSLRYLRNLVLTPEARLYKIGAFIEVDGTLATPGTVDGWQAYLYDDQMTGTSRDGAAQYFYETFLGCNIPVNAATQTRSFYELTRKFISDLEVSEHKKVDLNTGLYTYLKVEQSPTVDTATFATRFLEGPAMRDAFTGYMRTNGFPAVAVTKDLSDLTHQLRRRSVVFRSDIRLSAPAEKFQDLLTIEPINGDPAADGSPQQWIRITVKDHIRTEQ